MDRSFEIYRSEAMDASIQERTRRRIDWLCSRAEGRVLDVGCSQGVVPWLLAQKDIEVVGVDTDTEALNWAEKKLQTCDPALRQRITLVLSDFAAFTTEKPFDTIIAGEYLEHLQDADIDAHLTHMRDLLSADGRVAITVPLELHPHPDHHQTFFPRTLADTLARHFSIATMEVEDGYLRCVCDLTAPARRPSDAELLELTERGLQQIQKRLYAVGIPCRTEDVESYLTTPARPAIATPLSRRLADLGLRPPFTYDVTLFKALNTIYADKPLVPAPRRIAPDNLFAQADKRVDALLRMLPSFSGLKCLEVGCGRGETTVRLAERGKCSVTGVDITRYPEWEERQSAKADFLSLDITHDSPFEPESFDFIFSFVVLEHVFAPLDMLNSIHKLLKPGGTLYFTANLYRGPMASHRYREVFFPWPHLLFDDDVFEQFYKEKGYSFKGKPAWVNKLTHLHYLNHVQKLGFRKRLCKYTRRKLDKNFYSCFEEKLGKYPIEDLELDFIRMQLIKKQEKESINVTPALKKSLVNIPLRILRMISSKYN